MSMKRIQAWSAGALMNTHGERCVRVKAPDPNIPFIAVLVNIPFIAVLVAFIPFIAVLNIPFIAVLLSFSTISIPMLLTLFFISVDCSVLHPKIKRYKCTLADLLADPRRES